MIILLEEFADFEIVVRLKKTTILRDARLSRLRNFEGIGRGELDLKKWNQVEHAIKVLVSIAPSLVSPFSGCLRLISRCRWRK